jgi:hypothetical protein
LTPPAPLLWPARLAPRPRRPPLLLSTPPRPRDVTAPWRVAITPSARAVTPQGRRRRPSCADPAPPAYHPCAT